MHPRNVLNSRPARGRGKLIGKGLVERTNHTEIAFCCAYPFSCASCAPKRQEVEVRSTYLGAVKYLRTDHQCDSSPTLCYTALAFASPGDSRPGHTPKWQSMRTCIARYVRSMLYGEELAVLTANAARNERCISSRYRKQHLQVHVASMTDT
jgi:hypothetical protein